jgi:hypothetical protein
MEGSTIIAPLRQLGGIFCFKRTAAAAFLTTPSAYLSIIASAVNNFLGIFVLNFPQNLTISREISFHQSQHKTNQFKVINILRRREERDTKFTLKDNRMASFNAPVDVTGDGYLVTPIKISLGNASFLLLCIGIILLGLFFVLEGSKSKPSPLISLPIAATSALSLGFGLVVTFMWAGIFV